MQSKTWLIPLLLCWAGVSLAAPVGTAFTYQGELKEFGAPASGAFDFRFQLYDAATGGTQVGATLTRTSVPVTGGIFTVSLDFGAVFDGAARWLRVQVRPAATGGYTALSPRQALTGAPYALGLAPGAATSGAGPSVLSLTNTYTGSGAAYGLIGEAKGPNGSGILGVNVAPANNGAGVLGYSSSTSLGSGVFGWSFASSGTNIGVGGRNNSPAGYAGWFENVSSDGVALFATSSGGTKSKATLRVDNIEPTNGIAAYLTNDSAFATAHFFNGGTGQVLWLQNGGTDASGSGGGDFVTAVNEPSNDAQFRVLSSGEVRSDVGFFTPAADFAEMLPAVDGLEPGEVLAIGPDGALVRTSEAYQASVVGVYSTRPGFVGGQPVEGELTGHVPLAIIGIVPVKASTENGSIRRGDLLASATLPGHAMRAGQTPAVGTVIGKALEPLEADTGLISVLVMLQ